MLHEMKQNKIEKPKNVSYTETAELLWTIVPLQMHLNIHTHTNVIDNDKIDTDETRSKHFRVWFG